MGAHKRAVASSRIFAPAAARLADRTRHLTALRLLPFLFLLYLANHLDRTSIAYAAIGMGRELGFSDRVSWTRSWRLFYQLCRLANPRRAPGGTLERPAHDFADHDGLGFDDGVDRFGTYSFRKTHIARFRSAPPRPDSFLASSYMLSQLVCLPRIAQK